MLIVDVDYLLHCTIDDRYHNCCTVVCYSEKSFRPDLAC